jgi:hypothetical protein
MTSNETLFSLASSAVLPGWLLLVAAPAWKWTTRLVCGVVLPALLGLLYVYLIAVHWAGSQGGFGSLAEVRQLFDNPGLLLAGWVHYLAFDLFVGAWEVRDARRLALPHLAVVPCLLLTFLFGPIGLLLYLALRGTLRGRLLLEID